jgi:hypothetical protein
VDKFITAFEHLAARLNSLAPDPDARCFFEQLSGALIWTDERPGFPTDLNELGALRMLWNYRTSLLLGKPRTEFKSLWTAAKKLAPHWPCFLPDRRQPHPDLLALLPESVIRSHLRHRKRRSNL